MSRAVSLRTFLDVIYKDGSIFFDTPVVLFGARAYPLLFFSMLLQATRKNAHNYVTVLDLKSLSKQLFGSALLQIFQHRSKVLGLNILLAIKGPIRLLPALRIMNSFKKLSVIM